MAVARLPAVSPSGSVSAYYGFRERAPAPVRRREGPGHHVVLLISFDEAWTIDSTRVTSFVAGLHQRQVTTEHRGSAFGIHVDLAPPAASALFRLSLHGLANRAVALEELLDEPNLVDRLHLEPGWHARFDLLDRVLQRRFDDAPPPCDGVTFAWRRLCETGGRVRIASLSAELGWSRKRMAGRFREHVGLSPKAAARLIRFERARSLAETSPKPDWARIAVQCGYYDQSHLINDFRTVTGLTPETFFQDALRTST